MTRLAYLFHRYFEKTATPEERAEFMQLSASEEHARELSLLMEQAWQGSGTADGITGAVSENPLFDEEQSQSMLRNVLDRAMPGGEDSIDGILSDNVGRIVPDNVDAIVRNNVAGDLEPAADTVPRIVALRRFRWARPAAAAAIGILLLGAGIWRMERHNTPTAPLSLAQSTANPSKQIVSPGGNKAVLILNDGSTLVLDSARKGTLVRQGTTQVVQLEAGRLAYTGSSQRQTGTSGKGGADRMGNAASAAGQSSGQPFFNTIRTPKGGQYQVILPDGSKVWLNAATSLRFPTAFTGKERMVELSGEAYFEIAGNKDQPFRVQVDNMNVEVLGTHFNVMAYPDEATANTSLIEGAVRVTVEKDAHLLRPGQQARMDQETRAVQVATADTDQVIAWKNGLFQFEGATLETVMRQIGRWYDVAIQYDGSTTEHFSGLISRSASLPQVLHMLDLAGKTRFSLEGRTVLVKGPGRQ